ncbi:unnamed protein product [Rotaria sordida]|uniref:protein-tyrosine-phosphatase n=1 Tax=Rotaria sordida TaxID=392033 RepID=A0A818P1L5_9BILA|nr:unnamed protein product [Rotaria sordida]CAF1308267.1 unnamed protein product [Rotaria sordida]CAF3586460.1 unnamed protein product [Rotaria sordida]CAF3614216.1 unnamed protein product [Rotaria sordida]
MATDVLEENRFKNQCSLYESTHVQLTNGTIHHHHHHHPPTTSTVLNASSISTTTHNRRVKYPTQTNLSSSHSLSNSIHNRHSGSADIFNFIRSFARKPFKTSSMTNAVAGGETSNVIGGSNIRNKSSVSLLRYRPLSDVLTDHTSYTQSNHAVEEFLKHMEWSENSTTNETRVKWNTAMKFLIPTKFDVNRAIDLYKTHENLRKTEKLDRIWIKNPYLIREIESNKFFSLSQIPNQPLTVIFTASNLNYLTLNDSLSQQDHELITLQALVCQLDVATESIEVQQNGLNFIYDMQNYSASQFNINLSKKIVKLLQGGYPAMVKNIFAISAPKWFRVIYKVTFCTVDQIRERLTTQYGYSLDNIPISLGGTYDPMVNSRSRYQICLSKVINNHSICYPYYSLDYQPMTTKSMNDNFVFNNNHHNHDKSSFSLKTTTTTTTTSPSSLIRFVSSRRNNESLTEVRMRKRESSLSNDHDKRRRSNESLLIEEESPTINSSSSLSRKENYDDQLKRNENCHHDYNIRKSMNENECRELKCDIKRTAITNLYKPLNETEFLSKTHSEIRQEFRKMPNPPAKDTHVAKYEENLDKSRYRDVLPGESTRVKLQEDTDDQNDFINANYVSGYNNQEKAYIFTQGPLQATVKDFWRMIWQENISIIVMTTNIRESGTMKCYPYWPLKIKEYLNTGLYQIQNEKSDPYDSFIITTLLLKKKTNSEIRTIYHAHYLKWPDHGIPTGTKDALLFLEKVEYYKELTKTKSPILLHCSAGIGRTGTFCAIDIGIKRYLNEKIIDIPSTVIKMRQERAGSVQTEDQYLFVYLALMDFIKRQQIIQEKNHNLELRNSKKSFELDQINKLSLINTSNIINLQESISQQIKTSNDSLVTNIQHLISSTNDIIRQQTSLMPSTNDNEIDRKIRT